MFAFGTLVATDIIPLALSTQKISIFTNERFSGYEETVSKGSSFTL